jgi:glc operon protein GlcG
MNTVYNYALALCSRAFDIAQSMDLNVSIIATDLGGHPIVVLRGDRTSFATIEAARRKAVAAGAMQMSTAALAEMFSKDPLVQTAVHASGDMLVVPGGFPLIVGPGCMGGLGIAGGHYQEDHIVGEKAFAALKADEASRKTP